MPETHTPQNEAWREVAGKIFSDAPFVTELGGQLDDCGPGWVESSLTLKDSYRQQAGFVHAGVIATLADHSGGAAAGSLMPAGKRVLTVEYKINLLRPAQGDSLRCRSDVVKAGRTITVSQSDVFAQSGTEEKLVATATVTLAIV